MPTPALTRTVPFESLPASAQLHIFQLLCDSCPPDTPGTCWLGPVCKAWRGLARSVKGLKVVFCSEQQQADSFRSWLRRHAPQVVALGITSMKAEEVLATLAATAAATPEGGVERRDAARASMLAALAAGPGAEPTPSAIAAVAATVARVAAEQEIGAAALLAVVAATGRGRRVPEAPPPPSAIAAAGAAAGAGHLPLRRLVITDADLLDPEVCWGMLQPLLGALPHLEHLHLALTREWLDKGCREAAGEAAVAALAPLQHSTALTSLALRGPSFELESVSDEAYAQVLAGLPSTLRSLDWQRIHLHDPRGLSFDHLTGLTRLSLRTLEWGTLYDDIPGDAFTALTQLRRLELYGATHSGQGLLAHKERLAGLGLGPCGLVNDSRVLPQLTHLQTLDLTGCAPVEDPLPHAPALRELRVFSAESEEESEEWSEEEEEGEEGAAWSSPWPLQQYQGLSRLERLDVEYRDFPLRGPLGLCSLTQLKQLSLSFEVDSPLKTAARVSWACALAGLVNLEVLSVQGFMVDCWHHWLTGLTRLVVLEVTDMAGIRHIPAAAAHISRLLAPAQGSTSSRHDPSSSSSSSSQSAPPVQGPTGQVRVVCLQQRSHDMGQSDSESMQYAARLRTALVAAVRVLPPKCHLFRGSWRQLQECGVELWPPPVAARLQQLVLQ